MVEAAGMEAGIPAAAGSLRKRLGSLRKSSGRV